MKELRRHNSRSGYVKEMMVEADLLFTLDIISEDISRHLKLPDTNYERTMDLTEHMESYRSWMELSGVFGPIMCRAFSLTLKGITRH